jgi:hypothetical protein
MAAHCSGAKIFLVSGDSRFSPTWTLAMADNVVLMYPYICLLHVCFLVWLIPEITQSGWAQRSDSQQLVYLQRTGEIVEG